MDFSGVTDEFGRGMGGRIHQGDGKRVQGVRVVSVGALETVIGGREVGGWVKRTGLQNYGIWKRQKWASGGREGLVLGKLVGEKGGERSGRRERVGDAMKKFSWER